MTPDRRQRLLRQLTRLREIEHRTAALAAADALADAEKQATLARRAQALLAGAGDAAALATAQDLAGHLTSGSSLRSIAQTAIAQARARHDQAEAQGQKERHARRKLDLLAERRRVLAMEARREGEGAMADASGAGQLARIVNSRVNRPGRQDQETPCK